jgi:hypothetical protein
MIGLGIAAIAGAAVAASGGKGSNSHPMSPQ